MVKALFLLKRIPEITHEQFREHYEQSHVVMAKKYIGHLMVGYERNYVSEVRVPRSQGSGTRGWEFDCITEWLMPNDEAFEEVFRIFKIPEIGKEFYDDEANFLAREATITILSRDGDVVNTGTGGGHGTLARMAL